MANHVGLSLEKHNSLKIVGSKNIDLRLEEDAGAA